MRNIHDSMQLDSDQVIATLEDGAYTASLEVRGSVRVFWNDETTPYRYPSEFPKELKKLIAEYSQWELNDKVYVDENNWFEVFVTHPGYESVPDAIVVDVEGYTADQIEELLDKIIQEIIRQDKNETK